MLQNAVLSGAEQYVILGAGMDTFAFRNGEMLNRIDVFEIDHPSTQQFKLNRIQAANWRIPHNLYYVPADFSADDFATRMKQTAFDSSKRTFFSWLGVTYYLSKEHIQQMLKAIASVAPPGSSIVFDYADEHLFDAAKTVKRVQHMVAMAQAAGEPMKSCYRYRELEAALEQAGLLIYEHLTPEQIEEKYFQNRSDYLHAFENINYVLAVVR